MVGDHLVCPVVASSCTAEEEEEEGGGVERDAWVEIFILNNIPFPSRVKFGLYYTTTLSSL